MITIWEVWVGGGVGGRQGFWPPRVVAALFVGIPVVFFQIFRAID
jgi:hypothetical protein